MTTQVKNKVNLKKCQVEAEIIGFLVGRKLSMDSADYVPRDIDKYHTLPLRSLNRVAKKLYSAFQTPKGRRKKTLPRD